MELLDNQKLKLSVEGTNGETNPDGSAEKAPVFGGSWSATPGVAITPSEDGMSADVVADDIAEGGAPVSGTVSFGGFSSKEKADAYAADNTQPGPDLTADENFLVSNPSANSIKMTVGTAVPKDGSADAKTAKAKK